MGITGKASKKAMLQTLTTKFVAPNEPVLLDDSYASFGRKFELPTVVLLAPVCFLVSFA